MRYWLMKTEPGVFGLADLQASPGQTTAWEGVRNYQARNFMQRDMTPGDRVLFYHSNANPSAVVATALVASPAQPDLTALDPNSPYFDPRATPENPRWYMVTVKLDQVLPRPVTLAQMRQVPALLGMLLLQKGMRLSVQPVTPEEFQQVLALGGL